MADDAAANPFAKFNADSPYYQGAEPGAPAADAPPAPAPAAAPPTAPPGNPFAKFNADDPEYQGAQPAAPETTAAGAAASHAAMGVLPAAGGLAAAGAGAAFGAELGSIGGPIGTGAGAIIGGIVGAFAGGYGVSKAQDYAIEALPDSYKDPLKRTLAAQEQQHPDASFAGGLIPYAFTMSPFAAASGLASNATNLQRLMANPMTQRLFSGAIVGAQELGSEAVGEDSINLSHVLLATEFGAVFYRANPLGQRLIGSGERAAGIVGAKVPGAEPASPTVREAVDAGVFQPESVFMGSEEPSPNMARSAADARSAELNATEPPPVPDVAPLARRMEPDLFSRADELTTQREEFRRQLTDLKNPPQEHIDALEAQKADLEKQLPGEGEYQGGKENRRLRANIRDLDRQAQDLRERQAAWAEGKAEETPEMAAIRAHLTAADEELRDLGPQMSAAYRRAAEHTGGEFVEPEAHAPPEEVAPPAPDLASGAPPEQPPAAPKPTILEDVRNQAMDAGRPPEEAEAIARIEQAYYQTLARDFGTTSDKLYELEKTAIGRNDKRQGGGLFKVKDAERTITLFRDADASTLVHEKGHEYLERMLRMAGRDDASEEFKARAQKALDWLGLKSADELDYEALTSQKDKERATKAEEKFAKAFEQYLREGVAPSRELASVFGRFKQWLTQIYKTLKGLGAPINEDIKSVFDRMLSSEPERTVVAGESSSLPQTLADLHELDRHQTEPAEAAPAADRIAAETTRATAELPEEIRNEIDAEAQRIQAERDAKSGGKDGEREGAGANDAGGGEESERVVGGEAGGEQPGAELGGGERPVREGAGLPRPEQPSGRSGPDARSAAPTPTPLLSAGRTDLVDKLGNIRLENITSETDFRAAIRASVEMNPTAVEQGRVTYGELKAAADASGLTVADLNPEKLADLAGSAEKVRNGLYAIRQALADQAEITHGIAKTITGESTPEELLNFAKEWEKLQLISGAVSKTTAESGRTLGMSNRSLTGMDKAKALDELLKETTGRDLFQLRKVAKLTAALDTPAKVSRFLRDGMKRSAGRMLLEYWINGLISGPATHSTYMVGNTLLVLHDAVLETGAAGLIGSARHALGRPGEYVRVGEVGAKLTGGARALPAAVQSGGEGLRSGLTTLLPGEKGRPTAPFQGDADINVARQMTNDPVSWGEVGANAFGAIRGLRDGILSSGALLAQGGVSGSPAVGLRYSPLGQIPDFEVRGMNVLPLGSALRAPGRAIAGIHSFFRMAGYSMEVNAEAFRAAKGELESGAIQPHEFDSRVAHWRQNPSEEMMDRARTGATQRTLMSQGGEFVKTLSKMTNTSFNLPGLGDTQILKFIDPFVHIASNVIEQAIVHRTPVGLLSPEIRDALAGKHGNVAQDMASARMLVGTAMAVTFGTLAAEGFITGSAPVDQKERSNWLALGNQAHSVRIGDTWYAMNRLGPLGMLMGISADLYHVAHHAEAGEFQKATASLHHAIVQNVLDESFMRGPAELLQAIEDPGRYGERYVANFLSSFTPMSVGMAQVNRAIDPYSRDARTVADSIIAKIPNWSQTLNPRRDRWGQPVPNREALGGAGISAIYESKVNTDPVNVALSNLGIAPARVLRRIGNIDLTPAQYDDYSRLSGTLLKANLDKLVGSEMFAPLPANSQRLAINHMITASHTTARSMMLMKYPQLATDVYQKMVATKSGELKKK